ncbi:winged helix-turn-helix transcriptional regulator [Sutcliffiella horikoshii]|uniref:HTH-type transcriptional regulator SarZ n=1 Tax=Sutcliffiella horikoshii TaxID=79883 RepID=A0AA94WLC5_9BACI|nr:MarR family winged helix-turn-helix transcriptional regulator [Sutcliffiella horikoshii]TYS57509.1 winged helix-turn-helix transcriptional regulator [Sutcliffiella horikoshii]
MSFNVKELNKYWTDIYFHLHYPHKEKITHQVIRILQLVEKKPNSGINEVACYLDVSHNTASENVKRIIERKYLMKERDPSDERKVVLKLTDVGRDVLQRNTSLDANKLTDIWESMSSAEKSLVESAFKILSERAKNVPVD